MKIYFAKKVVRATLYKTFDFLLIFGITGHVSKIGVERPWYNINVSSTAFQDYLIRTNFRADKFSGTASQIYFRGFLMIRWENLAKNLQKNHEKGNRHNFSKLFETKNPISNIMTSLLIRKIKMLTSPDFQPHTINIHFFLKEHLK